MSHGKYQTKQYKRKSVPMLTIALVALILVSLTAGGTVAYLSTSAGSVENSFRISAIPQLTVNTDYSVSVTTGDPSYKVYIRAAVVPNWTKDNEILFAAPGDISPGDGWFKRGNFYYYEEAISTGSTSPICTFSTSVKDGYTLTLDVAAQAIQARGTTDADNEADAVLAVVNAWGIQPDAPDA